MSVPRPGNVFLHAEARRALRSRIRYKPLSDQQRGYEERAKVILERFAETEGSDVAPDLPSFVWHSISRLDHLADLIGDAKAYRAQFEIPLDDASELLRNELARILGSKSRTTRGQTQNSTGHLP